MDYIATIKEKSSFVIENFLAVFPEGFNDSVVSKDKRLSLMGIFFLRYVNVYNDQPCHFDI